MSFRGRQPLSPAGLLVAAALALLLAAPGSEAASPGVDGVSPAQIHRAYSLPNTGAREMIAVVVPYHHPRLAAELASYLRQFSLRPCTVASGCLRTINEGGQPEPVPAKDPTGGQWNTEVAISSEVARAVCQSCSLLIVEANSDSKYDLSAAARTAARSGAHVVTTTYTPPEEQTDTQYAADYASPGTAVVAAAGDLGYAGSGTFPAALPGVLAVGGTHLRLSAAGGYGGETAWSSTTSACSLYRPAPAWQSALAAAAGCGGHRVVADLSAVADPGVLTYVTDSGQPGGPWFAATGTSVSAPIIAGVIGLAGSAGSREGQMLYARAKADPRAFRDITQGTTDGCRAQLVCRARRGYDGPTGLGSPYGLSAFLPAGGALSGHQTGIAVAPGGLRTSRRWQVPVTLKNRNAFAVRGTLTLRWSAGSGAGLRPATLASGRFNIGPLGQASSSLVVPPSQRGLLTRLHNPYVWAIISARGPTGRSASTRLRLRLYAP